MDIKYSPPQLAVLVALRMLMGWYFLHQGLLNLWKPGDGSMYLLNADSLLPSLFRMVSTQLTPHLLQFTGPLNSGFLIVIGASLILGLFARTSAVLGIMLLLACYMVYLPLGPVSLADGSRFDLVNTYVLNTGALAVLYMFPTSRAIGLDYLLDLKRKITRQTSIDEGLHR